MLNNVRAADICLCFTVTLKWLKYIFCLINALQVVDQADTTYSQQTEALRSTPSRDADDLQTDKTEERHDKQSPRSPDSKHTEVMLLKDSTILYTSV